VYWERLGKIDPNGLLEHLSPDEVVEYHIWIMERTEKLRRECATSGRTLGVVVVQDLDGVGWGHMSLPALNLFKRCLSIDEANYPEHLRKMYVINTPWIFSMLWAIIKPWIDTNTLAKIKILGSNYQEALDIIKPEDIPDYLGGPIKNSVPNGGPFKGID